MSVFTFEVVRHDDRPVVAYTLPDERAVWCRVEALALAIKNESRAIIRVKDAAGETVIRTGTRTALASIEKCSVVDCPIKNEFERHALAERRAVA